MVDNHPIQITQLRKTYRDGLIRPRRVEALRGVSFQVGRGEIFGLLGPNGAGKTTLIKVLLGIVRKSGGNATLFGLPLGDRTARRRIGYLPENHRIPRHLTANTALEYYGGLSGLGMTEIKRRRPELLESVGLADWGTVSVRKFSKGMLQRLSLAQALLHDPELLMLDEPTDGVDPVGRSEMRTLLQRLKSKGKTIFINSHLLQEIELVCDRVVILASGQVQREGTIDELTAASETDVVFTLLGSEHDVRRALEPRQIVHLGHENGGSLNVTVRLPNQEAVDMTIDALRVNRISILGISHERQTLEEAFLKIVAKGPTS